MQSRAQFSLFPYLILVSLVAAVPARAESPDLLALTLEKNKSGASSAKPSSAKDRVTTSVEADQAFQKGATAAAAGQVRQATSEWRRLEPAVANGAELASSLDALDRSDAEAARARMEADKSAASRFKNIQFSHGDDLRKLILAAEERLKVQTNEANRRKAEMDKALVDRRAWVDTTFLKAKSLFEEGRYDEAEGYWRSLVPYWTDGPQMTLLLDKFNRLRDAETAAQTSAAEAEARKDLHLDSSAEFQQVLNAASEKIKTAQMDARTRQEQADQRLLDRREAIQTAFEKGRSAFGKDNWGEAVSEWSRMLPLVDSEPSLKASLDSLSRALEDWKQATQRATAAEAKKNFRFPAPESLGTALQAGTERLQRETQALDLQSDAMEKALAERGTFLQGVFDRGKVLYDNGQFEEAFKIWKTMGPYVDDEEQLNVLLDQADQAHRGLAASTTLYQKTSLQHAGKIPAPAHLHEMLANIAAASRKEDLEARNKTFEIEKATADRREWVQSVIKRGQALFIEGRLPEAVAEWNTLVPQLEDGLDVKAKLVELEKNAALVEKARKILSETRATAKPKFQSPRELSDLLLTAIEDLKNQTFAAESEKTKAEQTFAERRQWMNSTFELGRSLYADGKIAEATDEWTKLKPYLESQPIVAEMIDTLQKNEEALQEAKRQAVEAAAEDYKGLKLAYSDQMVKTLESAVKRVEDDTVALRERLDKTRGLLSERKEWSMTTFNKGKILYEDGRYSEALEQWNRLVPYLENGSPVKALIESYQKSYAEWANDKVVSVEWERRKEEPVKLEQPETLSAILKDAVERMNRLTEEARTRVQTFEKEVSGRKEWMEFTFQKGKALYDQERYSEAVEQWGVLGPYLSEYPEIRGQIEEAKRSLDEFRKADQILQNAEAKKAAMNPLPVEVVKPVPVAPAVPAPAAAVEETPVSPAPTADVPSSAPAPEAVPAPPAPTPSPGELLLSGEVLLIDKLASIIRIRLFTDGSEMDVKFDGQTQFDGETQSTADSLKVSGSVDMRLDSSAERATYIYIY